MDEVKEIKIKQDVLEALNVNLKNDIGDFLNVNVSPGLPLSIGSLPKVKVEIEKKDTYEFLYHTSKELGIASKSLITFGMIGILYGKFNITISQFLNLKISGDKNIILGIIGFAIIFETILLATYFYRDIKKFKIDKIEQEIGILKDITLIEQEVEAMLKYDNTLTHEVEKLYEKKLEILNDNQKILLQVFQKNIIFFTFKITFPIFIGYLGIKSIGLAPLLIIVGKFIWIDILILIIFSLAIIYFSNKFLKSNIDVKKVR